MKTTKLNLDYLHVCNIQMLSVYHHVLSENSLIKVHTLSLALPLCKMKKKCEIYVQPTKKVGKVVATYIGGHAVLQKEVLA